MTYLSQYTLDLKDVRALRITDTYSLHRVVYSLFEDVRGADTQAHSGILFADKGGDAQKRVVIVLSDRPPVAPEHGTLETRTVPSTYLAAPAYRFEVVINPVRRESKSGKLLPLRTREEVSAWFCAKAPDWGFAVREDTVQVIALCADQFVKNGHPVTLSKAVLTGFFDVSDTARFSACVLQGIGRGRAFGCGLLQIVPAQ